MWPKGVGVNSVTSIANGRLARPRCRCGRGRGRSKTSRSPVRRAFTVLELLTCVGVVGTLLAVILPAVNSGRESARRLQCTNNLRQIGLALHAYHDQHGCLPPGWQWGPQRTTAYGWAVPLLPFLEQGALSERIDRRAGVGAAQNAFARSGSPSVFLCPSDLAGSTFELFAGTSPRGADVGLLELPAANYVGVFGTYEPDDRFPPPAGDGAFYSSVPARFSDFRRGLGNTIFIGERATATVPSTWLGIDFRGEDAACRILGEAHSAPNNRSGDECEFGSRHPGLANFVWGDGRVTGVSDSIDSGVYRRFARRSGF